MKLSLLGEHRNSQAGKLFPATGQVKNRVRCNGVPAPVDQSIAGRVDDGPGLDDGESEPRANRPDLADDIAVERALSAKDDPCQLGLLRAGRGLRRCASGRGRRDLQVGPSPECITEVTSAGAVSIEVSDGTARLWRLRDLVRRSG
jgi:hypothetical protein